MSAVTEASEAVDDEVGVVRQPTPFVTEIVQAGGGDRPALVLDDGRMVDYADLARQIDEAAMTLEGLGLHVGHRMVLIGENSIQMVVALFACLKLGVWAVPLNSRMSAGEMAGIQAHCQPRAVFYDVAGSGAAAAHAGRIAQGVRVEAGLGGTLALLDGDGTAPDPDITGLLSDVAVMIYTSGSTGQPKGVMLTHRNLRFITDVSMAQQVLLPDDVLFHALPISHSFGLVTGLMCGLRAGACLQLVARFSAEHLGGAIAEGRITVFQGVPAMYARLHEWALQSGALLLPNRLRMIYIGGSLVDASRKAQTEALLGLQLHHGYGLTEAAPTVSRTFGHPPPETITAGWPIPGIEVQVQGDDGQPVPAGERGEICVRGPNVMAGYFRDDEQTAQAVDTRGWLHTGDIGLYGPAGDLSIVGRRKELIIRSGFNVYPAEVENAIAAFPGVAQCAVVGRTLSSDEEIVAYLEPLAGQVIDVKALGSFLRDRLAPYKLPSEVRILAQLPASSTGKLLKARLKELAQADIDKPRSALDLLLAPRSVAVVGASDNPNKIGGRPIAYLLQQGYQGRIYPVNPRVQTVQGLPAHASLDALPEVPDAVVLCVGSEQVEEQLALCARLRVPHALLFASSYAEVGEEGRQRQQRLLDICNSGGVRLVGPNSIGVAAFHTGAILSFASIYSDHEPLDGPIAVVSQSGAIGVSAYALLREAGWGVRCVAATGNEADLDSADFIEALASSNGVQIILVYVENVPDPTRMAVALAVARSRGVAVVALLAGKGEDGRRTALLHTGSKGAASATHVALFEAHGCRVVRSLEAMVATVPWHLGPHCRPEGAPRVAIVSNSGASCVMAADEVSAHGFTLASLSAETCDALSAMLPSFSLNRNPIDLTAMLLTDTALLGNAMDVVMADPSVDAVMLSLLAVGGPSYDVPRFARESAAARARHGKPIVVCSPHAHVRSAFAASFFPACGSESQAVEQLSAHVSHATRAAAFAAGDER